MPCTRVIYHYVHTHMHMDMHMQVGMTIYARVKSVNMEKFSVDMTCRSSDLEDKEGRFG